MFKKPVKIKSNNQIKGSERKAIKDLFCKNFPGVLDSEATALFNKKECLNCIKLVTHDNEIVQAYCVQKRPMFFTVRDKLFPTVFLLWRIPNLLPSFTMQPQVMPFISSGADLMLPGVVTPPAQSSLPKYGRVSEGSPVYVNLSDNVAAVAVGAACQSSFDMERAGGKGKCVAIYHFYGDHLCSVDDVVNPPLPRMGIPDWLSVGSYDSDFPELGTSKQHKNTLESENIDDSDSLRDENKNEAYVEGFTDKNSESTQEESSSDMDELLFYCFFSAIKYSKTLDLPVLISNFFKLQMLPMCPPGSTVDIKKTSYKKLKPFLDEMCQIGVIRVKEIKKGVEAITDINKDHPKFSEFYLKPQDRPKKDTDVVKGTVVSESYVITQSVLPLFQAGGYRKGDAIEGPNIRRLVTNYIKQNNCQDPDNNKFVKPSTDTLRNICKTDNCVTWEEVFEKVCDSMKNCFKVSSAHHQTISLNKGKVSPITMNISLRSGNKKVTIVDNLEVFGININAFAKECQHGAAASTSITPQPPGKKCDQLLVQGNQIIFIYNLLTEKYKIPKKYVVGLEKAPKQKK